MTPVELFKPFYSYTVANYMLNLLDNRKSRKLRVVEIGPGTGTFADSMLDFYKNYDLDMYRNCEYIFVEISPFLAQKCEETMRENHKQLLDEGKIQIFNGSIFDFNAKINDFCFFVGFEILDNMPHDRLYAESHQVKGGREDIYTHVSTIELIQDLVNSEKRDQYIEHLTPIDDINDDLINLFLRVQKSMPELDHISANKRLKS